MWTRSLRCPVTKVFCQVFKSSILYSHTKEFQFQTLLRLFLRTILNLDKDFLSQQWGDVALPQENKTTNKTINFLHFKSRWKYFDLFSMFFQKAHQRQWKKKISTNTVGECVELSMVLMLVSGGFLHFDVNFSTTVHESFLTSFYTWCWIWWIILILKYLFIKKIINNTGLL